MKNSNKSAKTTKQKTAKATPKPGFKLNAFNVTLFVIASFVVTVLLYLGLIWFLDSTSRDSYYDYDATHHTYNYDETSSFSNEDKFFLFLVLGLVFGPGVIAAAVALIIMKNRKN